MSENKVKFTIDGREIEGNKNQSVLEAALGSGVYIPHLCYHPDLPSFKECLASEFCYRSKEKYRLSFQEKEYRGCGLCVVEIKGEKDPLLSCVTPVEDGMEAYSSTPAVEALRQENLSTILAHHPHACLTCAQREGCSLTQCSTNVPEEERCCVQFDVCELRKVAEYIGIKEDMVRYVSRHLFCEEDKPLFIRDYNLCVGCLRCVRVCESIIETKALGYVLKDKEVIVGTVKPGYEDSGCRLCGACVELCPTGALRDKGLQPGDKKCVLVPCEARCPVKMDVPSYVYFISQGDYAKAADVIRERVPLALSLGYICHHPCEKECRRGEIDDSIAVCDLKRFALEKANPAQGDWKKKSSGKKVAVVGSGPAGLVASFFLTQLGHSVTVYEAQAEAGGMLRWAVPEYRLPRDIIRQEIESIQSLGVEILTGCPVNRETFSKDLKLDRWNAIFLAAGAQGSKKLEVDGSTLRGVYWGLDFLRQAKEEKINVLKGKVIVIGGGNVALDAAMTALRLGALCVEVACLEKRDEMPAFFWEIQEAEEEGIIIYPGWGPIRITGEGEKLKGVELQSCVSVFDSQGNFNPTFDPSYKKFLEAQAVILAVGQRPDFSFLPPEWEMQIIKGENICVNAETLETSIPGLFAGGEAVLGPSSAVEAMETGKKAASSIDRFLGGNGLMEKPSGAKVDRRTRLRCGQEKGFWKKKRPAVALLPRQERLHSFHLIQLGYREEEVREEAGRCLRCDLRFLFSAVTLPPEKWLVFNAEALSHVPDTEGAYQLLDEKKNIIQIAGTPQLKQALAAQLSSSTQIKYFTYEEDPMYTKRESELIQKYLQKYGHLPPGNEEIDDLF